MTTIPSSGSPSVTAAARAEGFHEVKRERRSPVPGDVKRADRGLQQGGLFLRWLLVFGRRLGLSRSVCQQTHRRHLCLTAVVD